MVDFSDFTSRRRYNIAINKALSTGVNVRACERECVSLHFFNLKFLLQRLSVLAESQNWRENIWQPSWCLHSNQKFHGDWSQGAIDYAFKYSSPWKVDGWVPFFFFSFPGVESQQSGFSTQSWIIGTMCALVLLVLIALMACFVRRNIGGKYAGTPPPQQQEMFSMEKGQSVFG